ncbi:hypothetical protein ACWGVR_06465 [Streptomyces xanthophaeus]
MDPQETWVVDPGGILGYVAFGPEDEDDEFLTAAYEAVHQGVDLVLDSLALSESEAAAVNLAVEAVLVYLARPGVTLAEVTQYRLGRSVDDLRRLYGWELLTMPGQPSTPEPAPGLACPRCGAPGVLKPRQWAVCSAPACTWGGTQNELTGHEAWAPTT